MNVIQISLDIAPSGYFILNLFGDFLKELLKVEAYKLRVLAMNLRSNNKLWIFGLLLSILSILVISFTMIC